MTKTSKKAINDRVLPFQRINGQLRDHNRRKRSMNKTELIAAVAEKAEISKKDAEKAIKAFTDVVSESLVKGDKIQMVGFGTFEVAERAARTGRNPKTKETIEIAASRTPKFKAGKALKDMVNE